jgi:hypothetical protein
MKSELYKCPICKLPLDWERGHRIDPTDGITLYCPNKECGMSDWGHGRNEKDAFEVFQNKCSFGQTKQK